MRERAADHDVIAHMLLAENAYELKIVTEPEPDPTDLHGRQDFCQKYRQLILDAAAAHRAAHPTRAPNKDDRFEETLRSMDGNESIAGSD